MQETSSATEIPVRKNAPPLKDNAPRTDAPPRRDYYARLAARFLKDPLISPDAKLLRALLAAFADQRTGRTYVSLRRIQLLMRCGRKRRSAAQNELAAAGWLKLIRERAYGGRLGRLTYLLCEPPLHTPSHHQQTVCAAAPLHATAPRKPPMTAPALRSQPSRDRTPHDPAARPPSPKRSPVRRFATVVKRRTPNTSMPNKK
jgi:hypothetical protein